MTEFVCIIPARCGSRGLPGKNTTSFCSRPLIEWTILHALAANVGSVVVCTNDSVVSEIATKHSCEIYDEPDELAKDMVSMESVLLWTLERYAELHGTKPTWLMLLQCTSPLKLASHLREVAAIARTGAFNSIFSVVQSAHCSWRLKDKTLSAEWPQRAPLCRMLRQQAGQQWTENGTIYAVKTEAFLAGSAETRFCPPMYLYEMPLWTAQQVDTLEDLVMVELIMRTRLQLGSDGVRS